VCVHTRYLRDVTNLSTSFGAISGWSWSLLLWPNVKSVASSAAANEGEVAIRQYANNIAIRTTRVAAARGRGRLAHDMRARLAHACARARELLYALFTMADVWRNSRGTRSMQCAHADIFTVWASRIANSACSSITTLRRSFLAIAVAFLISSGGMSRNNRRLSPRWVPPLIPVQPVPWLVPWYIYNYMIQEFKYMYLLYSCDAALY
jgi:hypothetical protein